VTTSRLDRPPVIHFRVRYERLRDRLAGRRRRVAVLRAAWLALLAPIAAVAGAAAGGTTVRPAFLLAITAIVFGAGALTAGRRLGDSDLARWLDRAFRLDDLLVTALEVDARGPASDLESRLLDDAATALSHVERDPDILADATRLEAETAVALSLVLAGIWLLSGTLEPAAATSRLPGIQLGTGAGFGAPDWSREPSGKPALGTAATATPRVLSTGLETSRRAPADGPGATPTRLDVPRQEGPLPAPNDGSTAGGSLPGPRGAAGAPDAEVRGGGGPGLDVDPAGGDTPWALRETVRRYFEAP
jgi:hypothetical protein